MPESLDDFLMTRAPTAELPLLGQTVLIVEDSRFASEALRLICQRSGARIRRADTLASAARHLRMYRPGIVLVDVNLPDGSGLDLVRRLAASDAPISVVMAMSGDDTFVPDDAIAAGANGFIEKPITSIFGFQQRILAELPHSARPAVVQTSVDDRVSPDRMGFRDDLALAAELLDDKTRDETLAYVTTFLAGVARNAEDADLERAVRAVSDAHGGRANTLDDRVTALVQMLEDRLERADAL